MEENLVKGQRVWWVVGAVAALVLALGMGAVAGGGLVYAVTRSGGRLPLVAAQGRDPGYGVVISSVELDGPADQAGIVRGDVLLEVAGERIENRADLVRVLGDLDAGSEINVVVLHGDEQRTLSLTPGEQGGRAYLGLTTCGVLPDAAVQWVQPGELSAGALVVDVTAGAPADTAGLQAGDVITAVDEQPVDAENDLAARITAHKPGDTVSLTVERSGEEPREVTVELGAKPEDESVAYLGLRYIPLPRPGMQGGESLPFNRFRNLPFDELPFSFPGSDVAGVIVQHVVENSPAEAAGLQAGDVITALDGSPVESAHALTESIAAHVPGDKVMLTVVQLSDGNEREVEVTLAEHPEESGKAYLGVYLGSYFQLPSTEEGQGMLQRWFFGSPSDGDGTSGGFQFRWPPTSPRDAPLGDDVGSL
jgi:serine protease Do